MTTTDSFFTRTPPEFDDEAVERAHVLERLAATCRIFGRAGFSEGLLGHVTVRDPGNPELFWANPLGVSFNQIRVADLVQVDHDGTLVVGERPVNPVGVRLHSAVHRARPEVNAVCHAHTVNGSAWSAFARPVAPLTQDTAVFHNDQAIIRDPRVPMDESEADVFAAGLGQHKVGIQAGHGVFTTGLTVDEAAWWFMSFDKACHVQLLAAAAGDDYEVWPSAAAEGLRNALGSPTYGWLSFQTLWDEIVATDPDLLTPR